MAVPDFGECISDEQEDAAKLLSPEDALIWMIALAQRHVYKAAEHLVADNILLGLVERFVPGGKKIASHWTEVDKYYE